MEVGNIVDLQVRINHAVFWVLPHSSGACLVEAARCLCQDTVTRLFLRIPVFQNCLNRPGTSVQRSPQGRESIGPTRLYENKGATFSLCLP